MSTVMSGRMVNWRFQLGRAAAVLLLVVAAASSPAAAQTWIEFRPEGIGYSVQMPGKWVEQARDIQTVMGATKLHIITVDLGAKAYITMHSTYQAELVRARPVPTILDGAREGAIANVKGKLRSEVNLTQNGHPGRQIVIDTPTPLVLVLRFFLMGNTMIQAIAAGPPPSFENEPITTRFVESLNILTP
jgi:hypothetical protein